MGKGADGEKTTGDIGTLGLGFGIFQAWLFMAVFSVVRIFEPSAFTGFGLYLPEAMANTILYSFLASSAIALIFIGVSNQRYLRFYVSKLAMGLGAGLCSVGTLVAFLACMPFTAEVATAMGPTIIDSLEVDPVLVENAIAAEPISLLSVVASVVSGVFMGVGSSLLVALWGTGFSRSKFTTIVLNTAFSIPLGVIVAFLLIIWLPSPISGVVTACLPFLAIIFLGSLTPMPFYQRRERPIFDPFPAHKTSYIVRIGIPTVIMGIVLGALRMICVGEVLPSGSITIQLVLGGACAMSIVVFVAAIAMSRRDPYWDTLFRNIVPIIVIGCASLPFIAGGYAVPAAFFVSLGYICLEVLMWVFFADLSNRFSLSPLFVFGLGRGILEIAGILGSALAIWSFQDMHVSSNGLVLLALTCATLMSVGYSVLPRYREFKGIIDEGEAAVDAAVDSDATKDASAKALIAEVETDGTAIVRVDMKGHSTGDDISASTSEHERDIDPLLAVDGVAEDQTDIDATASAPSVAVTPMGTDIASADSDVDEDAQAKHEKGSFYRRCDEISDQYMLSKREREVLPLLAKGHNAAFIQDKLCVSKSTAKTHINHIYKKLDIHTQQELLNMVEDRPRGPRRGPETAQKQQERPMGNNYMRDKNAFEKAVNEAVSRPNASRPRPKNGYRTSIFGD